MNDFDPEELERITARAEDMLARVEELRSEIDVVVGRGEAADGQVRVTAGASGRLMDVVLAPRAMRLDSQKLAEAVLRAAQEAQDDVAAKVDAVMAETLGGALPGRELLDEQFGSVLESFESSMDERLRAIDDRTRDSR
ncbi:YbaB/EbfC family nucleoid-associated protein [Nonomuraea jabiensis]|uniref:DNA-binding protein YbaB n=1 Tax=Nonomuraea jabiensis TaxID=882448 RepID=A0A7W9G7Y3_9ACTN|nr:YbaB/EbfC family nucleoid-associated protein [Nonomuraea jabiensis]MBB5778863.1 DNA-binding protein YbaB [Nonomuraea jabiensis]